MFEEEMEYLGKLSECSVPTDLHLLETVKNMNEDKNKPRSVQPKWHK